MFGQEIFGIQTEQSKNIPDCDDSVVIDIVQANAKVSKHFPMGHVFFSDDGGAFQFFLDTANLTPDKECAVKMYGGGHEGLQVADSFLHFLSRLANGDSFTSVL